MTGFLSKLFRKKASEETICSAVVPAAGSSSRMEGQDKLFLLIGDTPTIVHTLRALDECPRIHEIIISTRQDLIVPVSQLCKDYAFSKVTKIVLGGTTRTESVLAGIREVRPDAALIAVHDGARPFVEQRVLMDVIDKAADCGAAAPGVPVKDTIKRVSNSTVVSTLDRSELYAIQTPQVFEASLIKAALEKALADHAVLTDDCSAVERLGMSVFITQGSYQNIKLTTPEDVTVGEAILESRTNV